MLSGRCVGGPRDGISVDADITWDGVIRNKKAQSGRYHQGFYSWDFDHWVWTEAEIDGKGFPRNTALKTR